MNAMKISSLMRPEYKSSLYPNQFSVNKLTQPIDILTIPPNPQAAPPEY